MKRTPMPPKRSTPRRKGKPTPRIKAARVEDPARLALIRALPCLACAMDGTRQTSRTEAHHPRDEQGTGTKAGDDQAIPLCGRHHNEQHPDSFSIHRNPVEFHAKYGNPAALQAVTLAMLANAEAA